MRRASALLLPLLACCLATADADPVASFASALYGPSSRIFARPTEGLLVVVEGEAAPEELEALVGNAAVVHHDVAAIVAKLALPSAAAQLATSLVATVSAYGSLSDVVTHHATDLHAYGYNDAHLSMIVEPVKPVGVTHAVVLPAHDTDRLQAELALLHKLVSERNSQSPPRIIVAFVGGLPAANSAQRRAALELLARELKSVQALLKSSRPLFNVVFTGRPSTSSTRRSLSRVTTIATTTAKFQGTDYIIMVWSGVILCFVVFFIFCCIPWAPTLDPVLRTLMKSAQGDGKMN